MQRRHLLAALATATALLTAACGSDAETADTPTAAASPVAGSGEATGAESSADATGSSADTAGTSADTAGSDADGATDAATRYTTPLADACPETVVIQGDWWPQADLGWAYQLIGDAGTIDNAKYTYSGPLGSTGVNLEIRAGGPATGGQLPVAQLYSDDSILLGKTTTEDSVGNAGDFPTVGVFTYAQKTPLAFFWGNEDWDFKNLTDVKNSGETVLAFDGSLFVDVLVGKGLLSADQIDHSYNGDPARFVVEDGNVIQQGFLTSEVYQYEHDIAEWNKPVKYVLVGDEYDAYHSQLSIRADKLEQNRDCLAGLVPLMQQATVDYATDPGPTNQVLLDYVSQLEGTGWTLSEGIVDWANTQALEAGITANGPDGTFGSFDLDRVQSFIGDVTPIFSEQGKQVPDGLKAADIVTNEFLDPEISL